MKHWAQNGFKALTSACVLTMTGDRCMVATTLDYLAGRAAAWQRNRRSRRLTRWQCCCGNCR
jgi:hypothetical protein